MRNGQNSATSSPNIARTRPVTNAIEIPSESPSGKRGSHTHTPTPSQLSTPRPRRLDAALHGVRRCQFHYPASACGGMTETETKAVSEEHAFVLKLA